MVTVPALVWRYGPATRGLILGTAVGGFLGALAWLDSGFLLAGVLAFVILFVVYGGWMSRRMTRYWPGADQLQGADRERVAGAARGGRPVDDTRLVPPLVEYRDGLREAVEQARPLRWLIWLVLVVAVGTAAFDARFGSWGNAIVSVIYLVMLLLEMFWWPKRVKLLLTNADQAVRLSNTASQRDID
jgi:hypothetical protein